MMVLKRTWRIGLLGACALFIFIVVTMYLNQTALMTSHPVAKLKGVRNTYIASTNERPRKPDLENHGMPNPCTNTGALSSQIEDILCMERPQFLPNYKNPCWRANGMLHCLPYFNIIGSGKSATTDLFSRISMHPEILRNNAFRKKETWYWSWKRYGKVIGKNVSIMTFNGFLESFPATQIERNHVDGYHNLITGHGDPMDFTDFYWNKLIPQNEPGADELVWTTPYLVKHVNPGIKLLLILRDPVERLYSYYFFKKKGNSSKDFHRDVQTSLRVWSDCLKSHSQRHCLYDYTTVRVNSKVALYSSFYAAHLKEWLKVFPREQFLILRTEDYHRDQAGTLSRIFRFLNISDIRTTLLNRITLLQKTLVTELKAQAGPMMPETKRILVNLYREPTDELAKLVGDERFAYRDVSFK